MPLTRPAEISDGVSLSDKLTALVLAFVSKDRTIDARLPAVINEFSPCEESVAGQGSEDKFLPWANKLPLFSTEVFAGRIMSLIKAIAVRVAILC
jgi:hypothetical protein